MRAESTSPSPPPGFVSLPPTWANQPGADGLRPPASTIVRGPSGPVNSCFRRLTVSSNGRYFGLGPRADRRRARSAARDARTRALVGSTCLVVDRFLTRRKPSWAVAGRQRLLEEWGLSRRRERVPASGPVRRGSARAGFARLWLSARSPAGVPRRRRVPPSRRGSRAEPRLLGVVRDPFCRPIARKASARLGGVV
jgi:hypothetical protein